MQWIRIKVCSHVVANCSKVQEVWILLQGAVRVGRAWSSGLGWTLALRQLQPPSSPFLPLDNSFSILRWEHWTPWCGHCGEVWTTRQLNRLQAGEPQGGEDWVVIVAEGGWKLCLPYNYKTFWCFTKVTRWLTFLSCHFGNMFAAVTWQEVS